MIDQALVLVGGKATRLRSGGIDVLLSKSFIELLDRPLLFWNLLLLHRAGIQHVVIVGDNASVLHAAAKVIATLPAKFATVDYFRDEGNGAHGIPYECRYLLHGRFIIDCGHSISPPDHYRKLAMKAESAPLVFSAYTPHPHNIRQPVELRSGRVRSQAGRSAIAHPIAANLSYAGQLLDLQFSISNIIRHFTGQESLYYVKNPLPPEFDIPEEMDAAGQHYAEYLSRFAII